MCDKTKEARREKYAKLRKQGFPVKWARKSRDVYLKDREVERFLVWMVQQEVK